MPACGKHLMAQPCRFNTPTVYLLIQLVHGHGAAISSQSCKSMPSAANTARPPRNPGASWWPQVGSCWGGNLAFSQPLLRLGQAADPRAKKQAKVLNRNAGVHNAVLTAVPRPLAQMAEL